MCLAGVGPVFIGERGEGETGESDSEEELTS
jgi:hypothetical protein